MHFKDFLKLLASIVISELAGFVGAIFTVGAIPTWYATLAKPALNPPNWLFGPVWTALYALMGIALFLVWKNDWKVKQTVLVPKRKVWNRWSERFWVGDLQKQNIIAVFAVQWILNVLWSYLFFGLRQPGWAFFELLALWFSVIYVIINFYRVSKPAAWILTPYLVWVSFAAYLNFSIWWRG